ncbi:MAG: CHAT domain-containing protein [Cyanobacteria bacterium J06648_16]
MDGYQIELMGAGRMGIGFGNRQAEYVVWGSVLSVCLGLPATAQSITPNLDGTNTQIVLSGEDYIITGGTASGQNLFHSFEQFGLSASEAAIFLTQPEVLNVLGRINGGDPSIIDGQLRLSGSAANLYLINPVGVLFGPNVQLSLPGNLTVATADGIGWETGRFDAVGAVDYAALTGAPDRLLFRGEGGALVNAGNLQLVDGQSLLLAGGTVMNTGTVQVAGGEVAIAAVPPAHTLRLTPTGSLLSYEVTTESASNLTPLSLPELLTGTDSGLTVQPDGSVQLAQVAIPTEVGTVIVSGVLDVSDTAGQGGTLTITGDTTGVIGALLTVAGQGGGEIYVGGNYMGAGPLSNAQVTYVDETSVLDASAASIGNGGQVIVWSDQTTRSYGQILAGGGSEGGNGGFVETSSRGYLDVGDAVPDLRSPEGTAGTWLLDPGNLEIANTAGINITGASPFEPTANNAILETSTLIAAINAGGTVIVSTVGAPGTQAGNITVTDGLFYDPLTAATLELRAEGSIFINNSIGPASSTSGPLTLALTADGGNNGVGQIVFGDGTPVTISTNGGDLIAQANSTNLGSPDPSAILVRSIATVTTEEPFLGGSGSITFIGTGSGRPGVNLETASTLDSSGSNISLTGTSTSDTGVLINGTVTADNANLTVIGNSSSASLFGVDVDGGTLSAIGNLAVTGNNANNIGIRFNSAISADAMQLTSDSDIEVENLSAIAGDLTVTTETFFRALGGGVSLDSLSGSVTIQHGGNGVTPFILGNASTNGTAGSIVAAATADLDPVQSFLESFIQGNIAILTDTTPVAFTETATASIDGVFLGCVADCVGQLRATDTPAALSLNLPPLLAIAGGDRALPEQIIQRESSYTREYAGHLGLNQDRFPPPQLPKVQESLALVAEATGIKPAIIYVSFVPTTTEELDDAPLDQAQQVDQAQQKADPWFPNGPAARAAQPDDQLELILVTADSPPLRKTLSATHAQVQQTSERLRREVANPSRIGSQTYLSAAQQLHKWMIAPLEDDLARQEIGNLAFVMSPGLRSLPVSALHDGDSFLIERYSAGLVPSVSLTDLRYVDVRNSEVLAMGASSFDDQPELPAVPIELSTIAERLWPGDFLINETFTPDLLISRRQQKPYGIVHLATHGEFSPGSIAASYIQFWDGRLGIDQVRSLQLNNPPVELMVLSACRTALGNEEAELGFAGLAVQSGVKTALASLWKVDDVGTAGLMTQFYTSLREEPIKAEALRQAQLAMLKGDISVKDGSLVWSGGEIVLPPELLELSPDVFEHPFFWSAFTVIGSPW